MGRSSSSTAASLRRRDRGGIMLAGTVPFPPDYAARYRAAGYWEDRSLRDEFAAVFARFADRVALIDGDRSYLYADIDRLSTNLALNLLELGLKPLDRVDRKSVV